MLSFLGFGRSRLARAEFAVHFRDIQSSPAMPKLTTTHGQTIGRSRWAELRQRYGGSIAGLRASISRGHASRFSLGGRESEMHLEEVYPTPRGETPIKLGKVGHRKSKLNSRGLQKLDAELEQRERALRELGQQKGADRIGRERKMHRMSVSELIQLVLDRESELEESERLLASHQTLAEETRRAAEDAERERDDAKREREDAKRELHSALERSKALEMRISELNKTVGERDTSAKVQRDRFEAALAKQADQVKLLREKSFKEKKESDRIEAQLKDTQAELIAATERSAILTEAQEREQRRREMEEAHTKAQREAWEQAERKRASLVDDMIEQMKKSGNKWTVHMSCLPSYLLLCTFYVKSTRAPPIGVSRGLTFCLLIHANARAHAHAHAHR